MLVAWMKIWGQEEVLVAWMKSWGREDVLVAWLVKKEDTCLY